MVDPATIRKPIGYIIGLFALIGAGLGLTGLFPLYIAELTRSDLAFGFTLIQVTNIILFMGPIVGAIASLSAGYVVKDTASASVTGGVGSLFGFYLMLFISVVLLGGVGIPRGVMSPGEFVSFIIYSGIPTGFVGLVSGALGARFSDTTF